MTLKFGVHVDVDRATGKTLGVYFAIREGKAASVEEFADGAAFANYGKKGELLGIELIGPCKIQVFDKISKSEPAAPVRKQVRDFLKRTAPREMVLA